jgi:hypothetical protein
MLSPALYNSTTTVPLAPVRGMICAEYPPSILENGEWIARQGYFAASRRVDKGNEVDCIKVDLIEVMG